MGAQSLNDAAEIVKDDTATAQSVAEDLQREEVATARKINQDKTEISENKRTNNIQTDRDTATKTDASAKKDNEVCHDDATALQTKDTLAANNAYTAAEKVLQSTHDASKGLATNNKSNSDAEHTQRENTNDSNYEAATTLFNTKQKMT